MTLESPMFSLVVPVGVKPIPIFWPIPTLLKVLGLFKPFEFKSSFGLLPFLFSLDQDSGRHP